MTVLKVVFFNPYADEDMKGAGRRIEFLKALVGNSGVPSEVILRPNFESAPKSIVGRVASSIGLKRLAYFFFVVQISRSIETLVITEVIFAPVWRRNVVLTIHDLKAFSGVASRGGFMRKVAYLVFPRLAKRIIVVSESVRASLVSNCSVQVGRVTVVENGITTDRVRQAVSLTNKEKKYDFVYVSSFAAHKRHALLVHAAPRGARICFIGRDLGSLDIVRLEIAKRSPEIEVDVLQDVANDESLFQLLGASACGVFPSVFEGFGIPLLEYAASGLYVIASDIPPFRELAEYVDEFVLPDDEAGLSLAMARHLLHKTRGGALKGEALLQGRHTQEEIARAFTQALGLPGHVR